eukprot:TRINITY_DN22821_c0_g1_i1.p1 TRINITY_DN22821_c0_g1~~TRINITY_DN22821_c0_g1_i1.p1  ORF type:complete len:179 (+),score=31.17 TRINITY_DN22821_c0_g1_i1:400-936(+)
MLKTLERYQKCNFNALEARAPTRETQSNYQEYLKLKARVEVLQRSQRNFLGEDLGPLSTKELEQLERQLEMSLKQIRSTKTQYMLDQLSDLKKKEQMLQEANRALKIKLDEASAENNLQLSWEAGGQDISYGHERAQTEGFFQPLQCDSTLQIGYHQVCPGQINGAAAPSSFIPGWMV